MPWALVAVFGVAGATFQITLFTAFATVGVTVAVVVTACLPVVLLAGWDTLVARRLPSPILGGTIPVVAAGVILAGLGFAAPPPAMPARGVSLAGLALVGASSIAFAVVALAGRALGASLLPLRAAGLGLAATATVTAAFAVGGLFAGSTAAMPRAAPSAGDLALPAYVGLVATAGAYVAFAAGLSRAGSAMVGLASTLVEPAVAAALASLVLRERMTGVTAVGCLMVVAGVLALSLGEGGGPRTGHAPPLPQGETP